jgi:hypothetical protein
MATMRYPSLSNLAYDVFGDNFDTHSNIQVHSK